MTSMACCLPSPLIPMPSISISGPKNSILAFTEAGWVKGDALQCEVTTLGEAIRHYEAAFLCAIRPCEKLLPGQSELKYFDFSDTSNELNGLVDIHVLRNGLEICPKQDLSFLLEESDHVEIGLLVC